MAESFNGLCKTELIYHPGPWKGLEEGQSATLSYIDWFNNRRIRNEIGKISPAQFELAHYRLIPPLELVIPQDESL